MCLSARLDAQSLPLATGLRASRLTSLEPLCGVSLAVSWPPAAGAAACAPTQRPMLCAGRGPSEALAHIDRAVAGSRTTPLCSATRGRTPALGSPRPTLRPRPCLLGVCRAMLARWGRWRCLLGAARDLGMAGYPAASSASRQRLMKEKQGAAPSTHPNSETSMFAMDPGCAFGNAVGKASGDMRDRFSLLHIAPARNSCEAPATLQHLAPDRTAPRQAPWHEGCTEGTPRSITLHKRSRKFQDSLAGWCYGLMLY